MDQSKLKLITSILSAHDVEFWIAGKTKIGIKASDCKDINDLITLIGSFLSNGLNIKTSNSLSKSFIIEVEGINLVWFYYEVKVEGGYGPFFYSEKVTLPKNKVRELIDETKELLNNK